MKHTCKINYLLQFLVMKFCRQTLFEAGRALFMNNSLKINSRKSSRVLMVKVVLKLISSHLKGRQSKTIPKSADGVHGTAFT